MTYFKNIATAAAIALSVPAISSAATFDISAGNKYTFAEVLNPGAGLQHTFNVQDGLSIQEFALSASGNNAGSDVGNVKFGFTQTAMNTFMVTVFGNTASGIASLPGGTFAAGDAINIFFQDGIESAVSITTSFSTAAAPAPVPVPAAGGLLLAAIAGGGAFAARRKKKQQA